MPAHDFKCPARHITTKRYTFKDQLPAFISCMNTDDEGYVCMREATRQFSADNLVITYGEDGMAPPSQRMKGQGSY